MGGDKYLSRGRLVRSKLINVSYVLSSKERRRAHTRGEKGGKNRSTIGEGFHVVTNGGSGKRYNGNKRGDTRWGTFRYFRTRG